MGRPVTPLPPPPPWMRRAACAGYPPLWWVGKKADPRALIICQGCPVIEQCRAFVSGLPFAAGIWAGTTEAERDVARRAAGAIGSRGGKGRRKPGLRVAP